MGLWQAHDASRASAQAPTSIGEDAARTRPRTNETRESGKEVGAGHQEECKEWADGRSEGAGEGLGAHSKIHPEVLPDADTAASDFTTDTGTFFKGVLKDCSNVITDCAQQRTDDAEHEGCDTIAW